jgi:hypothetical protein
MLAICFRRFTVRAATGLLAAITTLAIVAGPSRAQTTTIQIERAAGPHLFVGEQYDISGTVARAVSFPVVGGVVQPIIDEAYNALPAQLAVRPDGDLVLPVGQTLITVSPLNGRTLSSLTFDPVAPSYFPTATEIHVDTAGRTYVAFEYQTSNHVLSALAIYPPGAAGNVPPSAVVPLPNLAFGIATLGNAVYVSDKTRGTIEVFAPVDRPRLVGTITGLGKPLGIAFDDGGELYACDAGSGTILGFSPAQRGPVHPSHVISVSGHRLCAQFAPYYLSGNEMTVAANRIFAAVDDAYRVVELASGVNGPQRPIATLDLPDRNNPWQGLDLAAGPR